MGNDPATHRSVCWVLPWVLVLACTEPAKTLPPNVTALCGDGRIEGDEGCDDGPANSDRMSNACRTDCRPARCGDGVVDTPRETCDLGAENSAVRPGACRPDCQPARCGDGVRDPAEVCLGRTHVLLASETEAETLSVIAAEDLDGDGRDDLVVAQTTSRGLGTVQSATVTVWRNRGPTFDPIWSAHITGAAIVTLRTLDADGDERPDLLFVGQPSGMLWHGQSDGTFGPGEPFDLSNLGALGPFLHLQDFNGDERPDLLITHSVSLEMPAAIALLFNEGGHFRQVATDHPPSAWDWVGPSVQDVDGDGLADLYFIEPRTTTARWIRGRGDGSFGPLETLFMMEEAFWLLPIQIDAETPIDFLALQPPFFTPLRNDAGQLSVVGPRLQLGEHALGVDLEGDLEWELVDLDGGQLRIRALPSGEVLLQRPAEPGPIVAWDLDRDGRPEVGSGRFEVQLQAWDGTGFDAPTLVELDAPSRPLKMEGAHRPDFLSRHGRSIGILRADRAAHTRGLPANEPGLIPAAQITDLDSDGHADFIASMNGQLLLYRGGGDGSFSSPEPVGDWTSKLTIDDFDSDGSDDLLVLVGGDLQLLRGRGDGTFLPPVTSSTGPSLRQMESGDLDGDRRPELLILTDDQLRITRMGADFSLTSVDAVDLGPDAQFQIIDFDGDLRMDVLITQPALEAIAVLRGAASGLTPALTVPVEGLRAAGAGDFDGDGHMDLVVATHRQTRFLYGTAGGTRFEVGNTVDFGPFEVTMLHSADLDGDGSEDLLVRSRWGGTAVPAAERREYATVLLPRPDRQVVRGETTMLRGLVTFSQLARVDDDNLLDLVVGSVGPEWPLRANARVMFYLAHP